MSLTILAVNPKHPALRPMDSKYKFTTVDRIDVSYIEDSWGEAERITVPMYFRTDLATVPRLFWSIVPPFGHHIVAAIVHDYCVEKKLTTTRKEADQLFYELMKRYGVKWWRRHLMYQCVRMFGKKKW